MRPDGQALPAGTTQPTKLKNGFWNNGDLRHAWLNDALADVRYEPVAEAA